MGSRPSAKRVIIISALGTGVYLGGQSHMNSRQLLLATATAVIALPVAAHAETTRYAINLPAGRLDSALFQVAQQTGMQLVFTDPAIARVKSPRITPSVWSLPGSMTRQSITMRQRSSVSASA